MPYGRAMQSIECCFNSILFLKLVTFAQSGWAKRGVLVEKDDEN